MKNKVYLFITTILISLIVFFTQSHSTIKYRSQSEDDQQATTLVQKINYPPQQDFQRLLAKKKITLSFTAKYNNLGTVAFFFNNYQKINSDWVWFRLKEKDSVNWYYQNKYNTDQFNPEYYFTFGFPVISNSQNHEYLIEIESISGTPKNSISLHSKSNSYLAKYAYPKSYLVKNPNQIFPFIVNKIKKYLSYIPQTDINKIIIKSSLPLLIYFLIILNPIQYFKKFKYLKNNPKIDLVFSALIPTIIFLLTFIISGYFSTIGTDSHHDGIMFKPALDVSQGQMLFKDTFTEYGALTTIIQALSLKIFGEYLIVIELTTAFFYALTSVVLFFIWSKILNKNLTFLSCLIWIFLAPYFVLTFLPWSSVYALFFECLTLYFMLRYFENSQPKFIFWTGVNAGLTFWCKQNVGGYIIIASLLSLILVQLLNKKKVINAFPTILRFIQGGIIVSLPIFIWIIVNGALIDWWKQSIVYALFFIGSKSEISLINSLFPASVGAISVWTIMPIATIIAFITEAFHKKPNINVMTISLFGLFSWQQYYPVTCLRHVYWAATPMVGVIIYLLFKLSGSIFINKTTLKYLFLFFLIYSIFFADINYRINGGLQKYNQSYSYLENPKILRGMKLTAPEVNFYQKTYEEIVDYKKKNGEVNLITVGPNALYVTFDKSENFHPMYINWAEGHPIYPDYTTIKNKYIENNQPLIFSIWGYIPPGYCRFNDLINEIDTSFLVAPCDKLKSL